ncbi:MAG: hypothetical protein F7C35_04840 [Desulfurococcales archaeon]|nr:hypothetical protein [Desulfurococcales archaeon]
MPTFSGERRREFSFTFRGVPVEARGGGTKIYEALVKAIRDLDMIGAIKTYTETLYTIAQQGAEEPRDLAAKASSIEDLADLVAKGGVFYAPFQNSSIVLQRIAKRVREGDVILSKTPLTRIVKCVVEVVEGFFTSAVEQVSRHCSNMNYETIALHSGGILPLTCLKKMLPNISRPKILFFGRRAREVAEAFKKETGIGVTVVPPLYAYQLARFSDVILFQPETINPITMLTRAGLSPVLEYTDVRSDLEAVGITLSLAYTRLRALGRVKYDSIPISAYRLRWQEVVNVPVLDIIPLNAIKADTRVIDEQGEAPLAPARLGRRAFSLIKELEKLVEARCRVYEVE